jgi:hypothetical protein
MRRAETLLSQAVSSDMTFAGEDGLSSLRTDRPPVPSADSTSPNLLYYGQKFITATWMTCFSMFFYAHACAILHMRITQDFDMVY